MDLVTTKTKVFYYNKQVYLNDNIIILYFKV